MSSEHSIHLALIMETTITYIWIEFHGLPGIVTPSFKAGVRRQNFYCSSFTDVEIWIQIAWDPITQLPHSRLELKLRSWDKFQDPFPNLAPSNIGNRCFGLAKPFIGSQGLSKHSQLSKEGRKTLICHQVKLSSRFPWKLNHVFH